MAEAEHLEKTAPVILLENRRQHLTKWISDSEQEIIGCEKTVKDIKARILEMLNEIDQIERALNALHGANKEHVDG